MRWALVLLAGATLGCHGSQLGALRFQNHAPIWRVYDRAPIAKPEPRDPGGLVTDVDALMRRPPLDTLALPARPLAWNINSVGGVPDSTWFENRLGVRELSPAEVARGPGGDGPDRSAPFRVLELDRSRSALRMTIEDARGERYLLKFDYPGQPETESGANIVVQRLLWAAGYFVPEEHVVEFPREALVVSDDAVDVVTTIERRPLTRSTLDRALEVTPRPRDPALFRALASKLLPGEPVGGYAMAGVRPDDPNDRVPHEHRRDVRALSVFSAWLANTDVKEDNTLDTWIPYISKAGKGYLRHYLIDLGKALGAWGDLGHEHDAFTPHFDYGYAFRSLLALGAWKRPWEGIASPPLRGVGRFEGARFRPDIYAPANPYEPFFYTDRFDALWAAEIIARFRPAHIAAAVAEGKYSDPRSRTYLIRTLIARQRKLLRYVFEQTTPLHRFRIDPDAADIRVCAADLLLAHQLAPASATRYTVSAYDFHGRKLAWHSAQSGRAVLCTSGLSPGATRDGYTMLVYTVQRGDTELPRVIVHVARDPATRALRIIGIERH